MDPLVNHRAKQQDQSESPDVNSLIFADQQSQKNTIFLLHCTQRAAALLLFLLFKHLESVQSILDEGLKKKVSLCCYLNFRVRNA